MAIYLENLSPEDKKKVIEFAIENNINHIEIDGAFDKFCQDEASFRLFDLAILDEDNQKRINALSDNSKEELISIVSDRYYSEYILDYDHMDDILRDEVYAFLEKK